MNHAFADDTTIPDVPGGCPINRELDPFSDGYRADPYPIFARARRQGPIVFSPHLDAWALTRYAYVEGALRNWSLFTTSDPLAPAATAPVRRDDPVERDLRERAAQLIDRLPAGARVDLVAQLNRPLSASHQVTVDALGSAQWQLLRRPSLWRRLGDDPHLVADAIEECLRIDTPWPIARVQTTRPAHINGTPLPDRAAVCLLLASADHDERHFSAPLELDIDRPNARDHLTFGSGAHASLDAGRVRLTLRVVLETLTSRFPDMRPLDRTLEYPRALSGAGRSACAWSAGQCADQGLVTASGLHRGGQHVMLEPRARVVALQA